MRPAVAGEVGDKKRRRMKHTEYLRYDFTTAELAEFSRDLARANQNRTALEQKKKSIDSQIKAEIEAANDSISQLSQHITTAHEYREIECYFVMDSPVKGRKTVFRIDTGEYVKETAMTDQDKQMVLDLANEASAGR
jgi:hypothetical protein